MYCSPVLYAKFWTSVGRCRLCEAPVQHAEQQVLLSMGCEAQAPGLFALQLRSVYVVYGHE